MDLEGFIGFIEIIRCWQRFVAQKTTTTTTLKSKKSQAKNNVSTVVEFIWRAFFSLSVELLSIALSFGNDALFRRF